MRTRVRRRGDVVEVRLGAAEAGVLATLVTQVVELLDQRGADRRPAGGHPAAADAESPEVPDVLAQAAEVLASADGPALSTPDDPALARLLPDAYRPDAFVPAHRGDRVDPGVVADPAERAAAAAAEFRGLTESALIDGKRRDAAVVLARVDAGEVRAALPVAEAAAWLRCLTDVRLALGARLDVDDDFAITVRRMRRDDPRLQLAVVYDWLGFLQESLVAAVARGR